MLKVERKGIVLKPNPKNIWEAYAVFNPAVVYDEKENKVHMFYRAIGGYFLYISRIGWAISEDFINFKRVSDKPVLYPTNEYDWRGVEDPRVNYIDGIGYVMTYTAVDESMFYRVGIAVAKKLEGEEPFRKIGMRNVLEKGAVFFRTSRKIYVIYRPEIITSINVFGFNIPLPKRKVVKLHLAEVEKDNLLRWKPIGSILESRFWWEVKKIGNGIPPIETDAGFLMIYHGISKTHTYRAGVALISKKDPPKVIARLPYPILEPREPYERFGEVQNVVYPTGGFVLDDTLYIYYGASDSFVALATIDVTDILSELDKYRVSE